MFLVLEVSVNRIPWSTLKDSRDTMRFMHLNFTNTTIKIKKVNVSVLPSKAQRGPHAKGSTAVP